MAPPGRALALAGALLLAACGCSGDDAPETGRLAYTVVPTLEPPSADAGTDTPVQTVRQSCLSSDGPLVSAPIPLAWNVDTSNLDECTWSTDDASITLTYGEIPDDDTEVWKSVISQHQEAERDDKIPGYALMRYADDEGGGPLWHFRYIRSDVEGSVYVDALNLYRDGWQITYEAESSSYNRYVADRLVRQAKPS